MRRVLAVITAIALVAGCAQHAPAQPKVRESVGVPGGGEWFPSNRKDLQTDVDKYLADAGTVTVEGRPVAVIAPHAGYPYSGPTAAYAFKPLAGLKYSRVILMGPSHSVPLLGGSITDVDAYATPLGQVELDKAAVKTLLATGVCRPFPMAEDREHSLQNEIPFLQTVLKDWKLVPIVVGEFRDEADVEKLAEGLKTLVTPDTLLVVSSDFTHYGRRFDFAPFATDLKENIRKLDQGAADRICAVDYKGFRDYMTKTQATICGRNPITVLLKVLDGRKDIRGRLVHYASSGEMTGVYGDSVSYASIVLSKLDSRVTEGKGDRSLLCEAPFRAERLKAPVPFSPIEFKTEVTALAAEGAGKDEKLPEKLNPAEQKLLLTMARTQLEKAIKERRPVDPKDYGWVLTPKLQADGAVFVTLTNHGELRGCIGNTVAYQALYKSVLGNAYNSALKDYRFADNPITAKELPDIDVEISYLTPMKLIANYTEIVVGKHGVLLEKNGTGAVFLPQVATEQKWDRDTMLKFLSLKAGLPADAWKEGCTFHVFEAQVFGEKDMGKTKAEEKK